MPELAQTRLHRVYLAERWGDTLVVIPRGDAAGFSVTAVSAEIATITTLAEAEETKHLIVDLSSGNYFGSIVLGALIGLGNIVRDRGGRIALCGASRDMQDVLRLMKLEKMWEMYPDRRAAMRSVSRIPLSQKLWAQRRVFAGLLIVVAVVLLAIYMPRPKYGVAGYEELQQLWTEVESRRELAGVDEWARLIKKCRNRSEPIIEELERLGRQRGLRDAEPLVLYAARDHLLQSLESSNPGEVQQYHRRMMQYYLRSIEAKLNDRPLPSIKEFVSFSTSKDTGRAVLDPLTDPEGASDPASETPSSSVPKTNKSAPVTP